MRILSSALSVLLLASCGGGGPRAVAADDAWVRLPAVPGRPAAAYFTLHGGTAADRLTTVIGDMVDRAELHASMQDGAMMTMTPLKGVDVPAGATVAFAPAGHHAMLYGLTAAGRPGGSVPLTLHFRSGATVAVTARAVAAGDPAP